MIDLTAYERKVDLDLLEAADDLEEAHVILLRWTMAHREARNPATPEAAHPPVLLVLLLVCTLPIWFLLAMMLRGFAALTGLRRRRA